MTPSAISLRQWSPRRIFAAAWRTVGVLALVVAAVIGGSIWFESHYGFEPSRSPAVERLRSLLTEPVSAAVGRQLQRGVRSGLGPRLKLLLSGRSMEETIAGVLDESLPVQQRGVYAYRLARLGTPEALAALLRVFRTAPPEYKPFLAQLLGSTGNAKFKEWLVPLLSDSDERLVAASIRGLAAIGGSDVNAQFAAILADDEKSARIRMEAAAGMATIGLPEGRDAVIRAFPNFAQTDAGADMVDVLGRFPFSEINATFRDLLAAPETSSEMRGTAVEALAQSTPDAVPFLLDLTKGDADPEVRASAAWAISAQQTPGLGAQLSELALREPDRDVRRRIYEALVPQADAEMGPLLPQVLAETDLAARVAGFNALATASARRPDSTVAGTFNRQIVPELLQIASTQKSLNVALRAVFALRRSGSISAQQALATIAQSTALPQVAAAAQHGLLSSQH